MSLCCVAPGDASPDFLDKNLPDGADPLAVRQDMPLRFAARLAVSVLLAAHPYADAEPASGPSGQAARRPRRTPEEREILNNARRVGERARWHRERERERAERFARREERERFRIACGVVGVQFHGDLTVPRLPEERARELAALPRAAGYAQRRELQNAVDAAIRDAERRDDAGTWAVGSNVKTGHLAG